MRRQIGAAVVHQSVGGIRRDSYATEIWLFYLEDRYRHATVTIFNATQTSTTSRDAAMGIRRNGRAPAFRERQLHFHDERR